MSQPEKTKHVGFKTFFGLMLTAVSWFIWTLMWVFGSLLPNYATWSWPELIDAATKYLFVSALLLLIISIIVFLAHMLHRFFWKAEETFMPMPA